VCARLTVRLEYAMIEHRAPGTELPDVVGDAGVRGVSP